MTTKPEIKATLVLRTFASADCNFKVSLQPNATPEQYGDAKRKKRKGPNVKGGRKK